MAGGLPTIQLLLDNGAGAFPYDITGRLRLKDGYALTRGRSDELSEVTAGTFGVTLNNTDGGVTLGSTILGSPSPARLDQKIRLKLTVPTPGNTNLLAPAAANFESGIGGWVGSGTVLPTVAQDGTRFYSGSKSLKITWQGSGSFPQAQVSTAGLTPSVTYTVACRVYVPTGAPDVRLVGSSSVGALMTVKDQWVWMFLTFLQGASTTVTVGIRSSGTPAASICNVDEVMLNLGATPGDFNVLTPTTFTRHTGAIDSLPVEWPGGKKLSLAKVTAADAQAKASRGTLKSVIEEEIRLDGPAALYPMGEPAGATTSADSSGNQAPMLAMAGSGTGVVFGNVIGQELPNQFGSATFAGGKYLTEASYAYGATPAIILAFATTSAGAIGLWYGGVFAAGLTAANLLMNAGALTAGGAAIGSGTYNDGRVHVVALRWTAPNSADVYIDGILTNSGVGVLSPTLGITVGAGVNGTGTFLFTGSLAHFAVFSTAPTGARLVAQSQAILTAFAGESSTARLTRLAGYANIPLGTLDASLTNVAAANTTDRPPWECVQEVVDAELGVGYIDGPGGLTFHNRNRVVAKTAPDITIAAEYLAEDTSFTIDMQGIINYYEVTAAGTGVTQLVRNTVSELGDGTANNPGHGRYPGSAGYLVTTDQEALDRGNWIVYTHAEPAPRVGTLVINLMGSSSTQQAALLAAEHGTWIRVTGLPSQTPGGTTGDFVIEGLAPETLTKDAWTLSFNVVGKAAIYPTPWILDDPTYSVLDSTTRVFV